MNCDELNLPALLNEDDEYVRSGDDAILAAQHIEACEPCQRRLTSLAAGKTEWMEAQKWLSSSQQLMDEYAESTIARSSCTQPKKWTEAMAKSLLSPPKHPEMLGRLGRYDIERLIGCGGMGMVFKAYDTELNRPVAIKLLAPYLAASGSARQRFAREARAAAAIVNDHVVPIHNVECDGNEMLFLVMQYVAGGSLQQRIDREGPLSIAEILRIGMQTANGLAAAHSQGLIHRDVKPSNILLDEGVERSLLTDFGLARAEDDACLTHSGLHPGTPHYMSPEQVRGETIDVRSDLFGLGCVLYALCTGHPPFRAESTYAVLRRITDESPRPIRETNPDIPEWLDAIVMKLLSKSPDARFKSADEVSELLNECLAHVQHPTTIPLPYSPQQDWAGKLSFSRWFGRGIMTGVAGLLLAVAMSVIVIEMGKGTVTIESNEAAGVPIRISRDGKTVEQMTVDQSGKTTRLRAGSYLIEIADPNADLFISGGTVELKRGGEWIARIESTASVGKHTSDRVLDLPVEPSNSQFRFAAPIGLNVQCATSGFPTQTIVCPGRMNLVTGMTHLLQLTQIPEMAGADFLASLELRRLTAKSLPYLEHYAVPIAFTKEDFEFALSGNLVTKAIYFADERAALSSIQTLTSSKLDPGIDPVKEAARRGEVIAVLRMGNKKLLSDLSGSTDNVVGSERLVPILGPTTAGGAPCALKAPSNEQILKAFGETGTDRRIPYVFKEHRKARRVIKEKIADFVDPPRAYPLIGVAQLHHAHYKYTFYFDNTVQVNHPVPHGIQDDESVMEIFVDHNHFHILSPPATLSDDGRDFQGR